MQEIHANIHTQILDDDLPDHFDDWICELQGDEWIKWADLYGREQFLAGQYKLIHAK